MGRGGWWTSLGDVVGNVVLFVPLGLLAARAIAPGVHPRAAIALGIWLLGTAFALALQVLQFWVPERSAAVSDMLWNAVGMALGQAIDAIRVRLRPRQRRHEPAAASPALVMALLWLAIEWWPFLPTIDWQHVKNALKPLLLSPQWNGRSFVEAALSLMVVAQLGRASPHRVVVLPGLVAAAAIGKLFLHGQVISMPHAAGWIAGLMLSGALVWRLEDRAARALVLCLALGYFTFDELRPFAWTSDASSFSWIPFVASLRGSLVVNTLALCWQAFWLGAVMLTGRATGWRSGPLAIALALWALLLELQQMWLPGRVGDITPAVMPLLWWLAMPMWEAAASTPRCAAPASCK